MTHAQEALLLTVDRISRVIEREARLELHRECDRLLTALRRIASLEKKNVPKYAQQIAREAIAAANG